MRRRNYIAQLACLLLIVSTIVFAENSSDPLIAYLTTEKTALTVLIAKPAPIQPDTEVKLREYLQQNQAMQALMAAKGTSFEGFLANQRKQKQNLIYRLKKLQQLPLTRAVQVQTKISAMESFLRVNTQTMTLITECLSLTSRYQIRLQEEHRQLVVWQAKFEERQRVHALIRRIVLLKKAESRLYHQNVMLQQVNSTPASFQAAMDLEAALLLNNQAIILIQDRMLALALQKKLIHADYVLIRNQDLKTIQTVADLYKTAIGQLVAIEHSLQTMGKILKTDQMFASRPSLRNQLQTMRQTVALRLSEISRQRQALQHNLETRETQLKQQLSVRQRLTEYHLYSWSAMAQQGLLIPYKLVHYLSALGTKVQERYAGQDLWQATLFWISLSVIFCIFWVLWRVLRAVTMDKARSRLSAHLYDGVMVLLYRNVPYLGLLALLLDLFFLTHVSYVHYQLIINLLLLFILFRSLILIARLVLLQRITDASGQDVRLYYRLKWLLLAGGVASALMVLSHQLPLSLLLKDLFNRLFMVFLLAVSLVLWKSKEVISHLLSPTMTSKKRYFQHAMSLLAILVPLILLTTALIGLVGYINLAWILSRYQAYLLLLITGYVLVRGLILDGLEWISEWMVSALHNGWLWIEVFLKPFDKLLRVGLMLVAFALLFQLFGWSSDAFIMENIKRFGHYPFVNVSGVHITLVSALKFLILLYVFTWASKWTREFGYRWLYRHSRDVGIRNSLSVFTQYAVILIGGFITLRVLGLDFSGMSMVIGGLAVGMGFGLRDFASNIIGGIMLLIERPVREGDLITLGEYEGRVAHIGIRSMRVSSWDNMEVLIPNAETFNKPFTNWTHQDSVVRTVVPIKVSRSDDPVLIQALIFQTLTTIPEILATPEPQVFLKQMDDALVDFEVRYFINVQLHTRFEIRSKVLFALMACFKTAGIKAPIPPISVELLGS